MRELEEERLAKILEHQLYEINRKEDEDNRRVIAQGKIERLTEEIKKRAARNAARKIMVKKGAVHKGDGKDVDHIKALSKGGTNTAGNLRVKSASANRSFSRNPDHTVKKNAPKNK